MPTYSGSSCFSRQCIQDTIQGLSAPISMWKLAGHTAGPIHSITSSESSASLPSAPAQDKRPIRFLQYLPRAGW